VTSEPLSLIVIEDPVSCAIYTRDNNLLHLPGWKELKAIATREKSIFEWLIKQSSNHIIAHLTTNTAMRFQANFIMQ
jgi:hypothetical protein